MQNLGEKLPEFMYAIAALKHKNFRLFWFGQCISLTGTWIQNIAQSWLVLEVTKSAFWLGVVNAVQFLPMLLFSLYAGTLIDRFSKRRVLIFTQISFMMLALILAIDVYFGKVALWHIIVLAGALGLVNTLDMPSRQSFIVELVGKKDLMNAIVLNSSVFNAARVIGPSLGGLAIAKFGIDSCFFLNAISYIPVIIGIMLITVKGVVESSPRSSEGVLSEINTGLKYVLKTSGILIPMMLMVVVNIFAMNFNIIIPLYAKNVFNVDAGGFGFLMAANGLGAFLASIVLAVKSRKGPKIQVLITASAALCLFEISLAVLKSHLSAYVLLGAMGVASITFLTTANTLVQTKSPNHLRGRIMSIFALIFGGLTPIGSFLTGSLANGLGTPIALAVEAVICLILAIAIIIRYNKSIKEIAKEQYI